MAKKRTTGKGTSKPTTTRKRPARAAGKKKATRQSKRKPPTRAEETTAPAASKSRPLVVGIGASAGGLAAFKSFFGAMPADTGMAFVLIPHLDPTHKSLMVELLARKTAMPVVEAEHDMAVDANCVYVIPPNKNLTIAAGVLKLSEPSEPPRLLTAIDFFLRSLARDQRERAIGIVLSGTGSHGTQGLKEVKLYGGMVMVQDPETAAYDQMPRSAIASGMVDYVVPPELMADTLVRYISQPYVSRADSVAGDDRSSSELNRIIALLRTRAKHDFRSYRKKMLMRRVQRRMGICGLDELGDYLELLRESSDEVTALYRDLLIGVTAFFREAEAFNVLEDRVIPALVLRTDIDRPVRVWVPACATGEEAYSIGMLLIEAFARAGKPLHMQIFASDIDEESLAVARAGIYPASIAADVSAERLERFFIRKDENHYQVNKHLRESITFALQNLISDAPFSRLDLVSCRNLLIYLEPDIQQKVIAMFHFALVENGHLVLGPSESIGRAVDLFEPISKKLRVFRRIGPVRRELVDIPIVPNEDRRGLFPGVAPTATPPVNFRALTEKLILSDFCPAAALISRKYEILSVAGPLADYLEFPVGELTKDLLAMTRQGLRTKVRAACQRAIRERRTVIAEARVKRQGTYVPCTITVRPITEPKEAEGLMLVAFQDRPRTDLKMATAGGTRDDSDTRASEVDEESGVVQQLESELKSTREDLQTTVEEMESSNEELKASNEEVMSMNEELQSANEELETSTEELQSLNEELSTVNHQLEDKLQELDKANSDMTNLMASSDIATVFLDTELRIVRFTPPTARLLSLRATDVGRPFHDFAPRFTDDGLLNECRAVLEKLTPAEKELRTDDKRYYLRRVRPYRTADNRIEGVVVTYFDITARVEADAESRRLATALRDSNDAVTVHAIDGRILRWNRGAQRMYGYTEAEALQMNICDIVPVPRRGEAMDLVARVAEGEKESESVETQRLTKDGRTLEIGLTVSPLVDEDGEVVAISTTEHDITKHRHQSNLLIEAISHLAEGVLITTDDLDWPAPVIVFVNDAMCRITGYTQEQLIGRTPRILQAKTSNREVDARISAELSASRSCVIEQTNYRRDGTPYDVEVVITPLFNTEGHRTNFVSVYRDITERKRSEAIVREREERLLAVLDAAVSAIITIDQHGTIVGFNRATETMFGYSAAELESQNVSVLMPSPYREKHDEYITRYLKTGEARIIGTGRELVARRKDGAIFPIELQVSEVGELGLFTGIVRDISKQRAAEAAFRAEHEFSESIIETARIIVLVLDPNGCIVRFNAFTEEVTGWHLDEVRGQDWLEKFVPDRERTQLSALFDRPDSGDRIRGRVGPILTRDGRKREIEWSDVVLADSEGKPIGQLLTGLDVTERRILERQVLEIGAEEQRRIGQDLHDGVGQELSGLRLLADALCKSLAAENASVPGTDVVDLAGKIAGAVGRTQGLVRAISRGLVVVDVDSNGLSAALDGLADTVTQLYGLDCCVVPQADEVNVTNPQIATQVFRIAQEATTNAAKHGQADQVRISLAQRGSQVVLEVKDDGVGFNLADPVEDGMGLRIMNYRADLIGGILKIERNELGGTTVTCEVEVV